MQRSLKYLEEVGSGDPFPPTTPGTGMSVPWLLGGKHIERTLNPLRCTLRLATIFCDLLSIWSLLESSTRFLHADRGEPPTTFNPLMTLRQASESTELPSALAQDDPNSHHQTAPSIGNLNCP